MVAACALVLALAALLLYGLPGGSPGGPLNPIAEAAQRTVDSPGARFSGTGTALAADANVQMQFEDSFDGEENRSMMQMQVSGAQSLSTSLVAIEDDLTTYMSSPLFSGQLPSGASWMKIDYSEIAPEAATQSAQTVDARGMLESLEAVAPNIRALGREKVRGVKTTHYAATIDAALRAQQLRDQGDDLAAQAVEQSGGSATIEVWIDDHDLIRRLTMTIPFGLAGGPGADMRMTIYFYDFGAAPSIDLPPDDQVFDATELGKQALEAELG